MLKLVTAMSQLDTEQLMNVYLEGNVENGADMFPDVGAQEQRIRAEDAFLSYLREDFFQQTGAAYAFWVVDGCYQAALRLEPYRDGLLLEALETAPESRMKGYATALMREVLALYTVPIYSHVNKRNIASLAVHKKCGFQIISDCAAYIDGTVTQKSYTLRFQK